MALPPGSKGPGLPVGPGRRQSLRTAAAVAPLANPTTWNPSDKTANVLLTGGNLTATGTSGSTFNGVRAVDRQVAGKFYWEVTCNTWATTSSAVGVARGGVDLTLSPGSAPAGTGIYAVQRSGLIVLDGTSGANLGTVTSGSVVCIAVDCSAKMIWFRVGAGNWNGSATANPAAGVGGYAMSLGVAVPLYPAAWPENTNEQVTANFGSYAFVGAVPAGFTPGFPAGVTSPTNALATQAALEEWTTTSPQAQVTQVALEQWISVSSVGVQAVVTQVALEMWASVATGGPGIGAGEVDAGATVTGAGATIQVAAGAGEVDAGADVEGAGFIGAIGAGEADAGADVQGMGALVAPPGALPFLPGLGWSVHRRPTFDTIVATHPSGAEVRLALWENCLWEFELSYDALASNAAYPGAGNQTLQTLLGFYLARGGQHGTFLFIDPDFNAIVGQGVGAGDGTTIVFPFYRVFGGQVEPVSWVTAVAAIYLDGVAQPSGWTVSGNVISFAAAPASGVVISADFSYGFICRFLEDTLDFEEFMDNLWELKSLKFRQVRQ